MESDGTKRIAYFYNEDIGKFNYGAKHVMDPKRISMAHSLIVGFGLYRYLDVYETREATKEEIVQFHTQEYIDYLQYYVCPEKLQLMKSLGFKVQNIDENQKNDIQNKTKFGIDVQADCPGFEGLYTFCQLSTGGSIDAAHLITQNQADIAINWGGGLHHAKKGEAYGFCYTNDIVVCILELLKQYNRVLYIDIDVHHGDGVEEAFFCTNRVMTVSFHEYGQNFFPGTGALNSIGEGDGLYHSINVPLLPGMQDNMFRELFQNIINGVMDNYKPDCVVFQSGADSIAYDKIGHFNLSIKGHGECIKHLKKFNIPLIVLGGGGYTINNVSRCWAYETGLITGNENLVNEKVKIPENDQFYYMYSFQNKLHIDIMPNYENFNKKEDINKIQSSILQYLREIEGRPSVQFHQVPKSYQFTEGMEFEQEQQNLNNLLFDLNIAERDQLYENEDSKKQPIHKKQIFEY